MLLINRYTCPMRPDNSSIQAHLIENGVVTKSYGKMDVSCISMFKDHELVLICDVVRASNLKDVNLVSGGEL